MRGEDLQRDLAVQRELRGLVHDPHPAVPQNAVDPVALYLAPDVEHGYPPPVVVVFEPPPWPGPV